MLHTVNTAVTVPAAVAVPRAFIVVDSISDMFDNAEQTALNTAQKIFAAYIELIPTISDETAKEMRAYVKGWNDEARTPRERSAYKRTSEFLASFRWYYQTAGADFFVDLMSKGKTYNETLAFIREERKSWKEGEVIAQREESLILDAKKAGLDEAQRDALIAASRHNATRYDPDDVTAAAIKSIVKKLLALPDVDAFDVIEKLHGSFKSARSTQVVADHADALLDDAGFNVVRDAARKAA